MAVGPSARQNASGAKAFIWRTVSEVRLGGSRLTRAVTSAAASPTAKR